MRKSSSTFYRTPQQLLLRVNIAPTASISMSSPTSDENALSCASYASHRAGTTTLSSATTPTSQRSIALLPPWTQAFSDGDALLCNRGLVSYVLDRALDIAREMEDVMAAAASEARKRTDGDYPRRSNVFSVFNKVACTKSSNPRFRLIKTTY